MDKLTELKKKSFSLFKFLMAFLVKTSKLKKKIINDWHENNPVEWK